MKKLRPYQKEILKILIRKLEENPSLRTYVQMPTGSGKTFTIASFLKNLIENENKKILWICHGWELINQAFKELTSTVNLETYDFGIFKGTKDPNHKIFQDVDLYNSYSYGEKPKILFSTFKSIKFSLKEDREDDLSTLRKFKPDMIIIDEAHYGKSGKEEREVYKQIIQKYWNQKPIIGLTATPKIRTQYGWNSKEKISLYSFKDLVEKGYLARPIEIRVEISRGEPIEFSNNLPIYSKISEDDERNKEIVKHYLKNKKKYKKTMLFAIDTYHAERLFKMLKREGVECYPVHSKVKKPYRQLEKFKDSDNINCVAVVVRMTAEGVDIPDLKTVMLARPVTSDIEFSQMVGRGSRKTESKKDYYIVDFYDQLKDESKQESLYRFKDFYTGSHSSNESTETIIENKNESKRTYNHMFHEYIEGEELSTLKYDIADIKYDALNGLRIYTGQTFGIEVELATKDKDIHDYSEEEFNKTGKKILDKIRSCNVSTAQNPIFEYSEVKENIDYSQWNVVFDGSSGFEIVSPILKAEEGFEEYFHVMSLFTSKFLNELNLEINYQCGVHINLGWEKFERKQIERLIHLIKYFEPSLNSLVSPSRVINLAGEDPEYTKSLRRMISESELKNLNKKDFEELLDEDSKYWCVNFQHREGLERRLEIRTHQGSFKPEKILLWTALWMNILYIIDSDEVRAHFDHTNYDQEIPLPKPEADIIMEASKLLGLESNHEFLKKINLRREELFRHNTHWEKTLGKKVLKKCVSQWEENYEKELKPEVVSYCDLTESQKTQYLRGLIKKIDLKITLEKLRENIKKTKPDILVFMQDNCVIGSIGVKPINKALIETLQKTNADAEVSSKKNTRELGYVFREGPRSLFHKEVDKMLTKYSDMHLVSTINTKNKEAKKLLEKKGFKNEGVIDSPYSLSNEKLYLFTKNSLPR